jgi:hypothetical protein
VPSTGVLSITGLNLSGLTASAAVATDASKNLVSVTNTGSGNNVLATSPTLVTPVLGTPTSGTLTNCTGLPVGGISATGTPSSSTYLRGDGAWAAVAASPGGSNTQVQYNSSGSFAGSANLTFDGTNLSCGGTVTASSDERLKTNWQPVIAGFVEKLAQVKSGIYDRTDIKSTQAGVSAQSLQEVLPQTVIADEEGMLKVAYGNAAMVSVIELAKMVIELKQEIANLKGIK